MPLSAPQLSIVTTTDPVARQLPYLLAALQRLAEQEATCYQVIIVDDLGQWQNEAPPPIEDYPSLILRLLRPAVRQGQSQAILRGISIADTPYILTIDPDLHLCVAEIPAMMKHFDRCILAVHGYRSRRPDIGLVRKVGSLAANLLVRFITGLSVPDIGSPVTLFQRHALAQITIPEQAKRNPRLYIYASLGSALSIHKLHHGSPSKSPSQYSFVQLSRLIGKLLVDSYYCRRLLNQEQKKRP